MKTATLELYEFVERRIKAIEETIEKKGQSLTLDGELIAYNEMKEEIVQVAEKIEKPNLQKSYYQGVYKNPDKEIDSAKWFTKNFKICPQQKS